MFGKMLGFFFISKWFLFCQPETTPRLHNSLVLRWGGGGLSKKVSLDRQRRLKRWLRQKSDTILVF